jgi:hypothetical protein
MGGLARSKSFFQADRRNHMGNLVEDGLMADDCQVVITLFSGDIPFQKTYDRSSAS